MTLSQRIIFSRALTNSGDQAWDFAVPVTMAMQMPHRLDLVAFTFFIARLGHIILLPLVGAFIDRFNRVLCLKLGLTAQFAGVFIQAIALTQLAESTHFSILWISLGGIISSLGSSTTNIAVTQDLVPSLFQGDILTQVNSRIRQVDLFSEVSAPFIAGLLLLITVFPHAGLLIVATWNLLSFFPEFILIKSVLLENASSLSKAKLEITKIPLWSKLSLGWRHLVKLSIAPVVFAYALLWLSALSPHGVLLTSFLKEAWKFPEPVLGLFRGLGAIFGLLATLIFPFLVKRFGLIKACRVCISSQAITLLMGLIAFYTNHEFIFLGAVLLSRIGLYGFSLGEQQIRQMGIPAELRGSVNATATALTGLATLFLLGLGSLWGKTEQFHILISLSVAFVCLGALILARYKNTASSPQ